MPVGLDDKTSLSIAGLALDHPPLARNFGDTNGWQGQVGEPLEPVHTPHDGVVQSRVGQIGSTEIRSGESGTGQVGLAEDAAIELGLGQVAAIAWLLK